MVTEEKLSLLWPQPQSIIQKEGKPFRPKGTLPVFLSAGVGSGRLNFGWMAGWMTCDFMSFSTVFQSYQDNGQLIMKGCVQLSARVGSGRLNFEWIDGWMYDLQFYILFNSISVISGQWADGIERLYAMEPCLRFKRSLPQVGLEPKGRQDQQASA